MGSGKWRGGSAKPPARGWIFMCLHAHRRDMVVGNWESSRSLESDLA